MLAQITKPMTNNTTPDDPQPMVWDYHGDLENRAFKIHGRLPGVSTSMHAPQRVALEDPLVPTEEPKVITTPPTPFMDSSIHLSILALSNHMQNTLSASFANILTCLDNQDRTIMELSKPKDPCKRAPSKSPSDAPIWVPQPTPPIPPAQPPAPASAESPANCSVQEGSPSMLRRMGPPPVPWNTHPQTLLLPPPPKVTWNKIATQGAVHMNANIATFSRNAAQSQGCTPSGKCIPGKTSPSPSLNTQVMVVQGRGLSNKEKEKAIHSTLPEVIVQTACSQIECITANTITLLHGRWSINPKSHNFVYTITGQVSYKNVYTFCNALTGPLLKGDLVPNQGWTYVQLRNIPTSDADSIIFPPEVLLSELRCNTAFADTIFCTVPHWQASLANVANYPSSTITMVYVDEDGKHTNATKTGSIYMFNTQVCFIPTGDHLSITQCRRCHELSHQTNTPACPLPKNAIKCYVCGKSHNGAKHTFHCQGPHKTASKCNCGFKCLLCKGSHHARA